MTALRKANTLTDWGGREFIHDGGGLFSGRNLTFGNVGQVRLFWRTELLKG